MEGKKQTRTRRIGTVTFGSMLVFFGILFLVHMFLPQLSYRWIFRLWPVILIALGAEVLLTGAGREEQHLYDWVAMFLMALITLFAMGMAAADQCLQFAASSRI